jgi:hypothetical protein
MNSTFKFGVISGSLLLVKFHLLVAIIISVILTNSLDLGFEIIADVAAIAYLLIVGIGHVRCSFNCFSQMNNPDLFNKSLEEPETIDDALFKKNHGILGVVWRMTQEWMYMKKTANLNFKSTN